ncbi:MAG: ATP-binding cassette domain-containing protein [Candidatus Eremiobacteraeota bacterium]|nr:ATP-binding cassette domain-containing protein [Candidatus Eremiobacteraeota bacterium]
MSLRGVSVRYPDGPLAVREVDLEIGSGELLVLLGASGSGKSTLLRTINRLVPPTSGTILIDGRDAAALEPVELRRRIGYVIQAVGLFPHLTVGENVAIVPQLLGWERARIEARVRELLRLVRLDPSYRERLPRMLSGGEQQRVGVARALAAEPPILLMDEPFGAVDAIVRLELQNELLAIHRELGTTIVFVTHDVDEALRLAQRVAVVHTGTLVQADAPLRLLAAPRTPYVADLVGAADVLRRLSLITAGEAAEAAPNFSESGRVIEPHATLREALGRILTEGEPLILAGNGPRRIVDIAAIAKAVRA